MTWKKSLWLAASIMVFVLLVVYVIIARQRIGMQSLEISGVRSLFPAGAFAAVGDAKNGWQGYGFARRFRLFFRLSVKAGDDFRQLVRENFGCSPLRQELALYGGGIYVLQKAGKGYRLFCLFFRNGTNYWADMVTRDSLHFARLAFEQFILGMEIAGEKVSPTVSGQLLSLQRRISPFFMQTPSQLLGMIAAIAFLALLIAVLVNVFAGSCPPGRDPDTALCSPGATLQVRGWGRRRISACCLCGEGRTLVIYRFRRPYLKIDLGSERKNMVWEKNSLVYKNIRVTLEEEEYQRWRSMFPS